MKLRSRAGLAWSLVAVDVVLTAAALVLGLMTLDTPGQQRTWGVAAGDFAFLLTSLTFPLVGGLIASRRAGGAIGWICLAVGLAIASTMLADRYAVYALLAEPGSLPAGEYAANATSWSWILFVGGIGVYLILLFPDGKLPSPRWRWLAVVAGCAMAAGIVGTGLAPGIGEDSSVPVENPIGVDAARVPLTVLAWVGVLILLPSIAASVISMIVRFRRSGPEQREQLKWFASAALLAGALFFLAFPVLFVSEPAGYVVQSFGLVAWAALPVAVGIAVLRYRLYDIDLVINKAVVFAVLATFITAVYVAIVVGVSALVGTAGDPSIALSIAATAIVAVAFQPARERAQRLANRLVYGGRATPYEVLAEFSQNASAAVASDEVLPRVARMVAEGTGAARGEVWLTSGSELRLAASWPEPAPGTSRRVAFVDGRLPSLPAADLAVGVRHQGELLGALAVQKRRGEALTASEDKLLRDLAAQAGLVLRNVGLTAELLARLDELTASRQRLVTAQDEERRRLERDLHDGAQQHLVALAVKLRLAAATAAKDPAKAAEMLLELRDQTDVALSTLLDLAGGIYPSELEERGIGPALRIQVRAVGVPIEIEDAGVGRLPIEVEAAAYFVCLEAIQNAAKYAASSSVRVRLGSDGEALTFEVTDDGVGFDASSPRSGTGLHNMSDRLAAVGGVVEVRSTPGVGTTVAGRVAVREGVPA